jgi:hypothetical protein
MTLEELKHSNPQYVTTYSREILDYLIKKEVKFSQISFPILNSAEKKIYAPNTPKFGPDIKWQHRVPPTLSKNHFERFFFH